MTIQYAAKPDGDGTPGNPARHAFRVRGEPLGREVLGSAVCLGIRGHEAHVTTTSARSLSGPAVRGSRRNCCPRQFNPPNPGEKCVRSATGSPPDQPTSLQSPKPRARFPPTAANKNTRENPHCACYFFRTLVAKDHRAFIAEEVLRAVRTDRPPEAADESDIAPLQNETETLQGITLRIRDPVSLAARNAVVRIKAALEKKLEHLDTIVP